MDDYLNAALLPIRFLAQVMAQRNLATLENRKNPVVLFVGAGASSTSGLPSGKELAEFLLDVFDKGEMKTFLDLEVQDKFPQRLPEELSLFELASVLQNSAFGRKVIQDTVSDAIAAADHRSIGIELIAHLAKHRFIDGIVSLNFDMLLDESIRDELPDRFKIIASEQNVPVNVDQSTCYLVKPFGSLGKAPYSLSVDDVSEFGPKAVREFVTGYLLAADKATTLNIVLVGYRGAEEGFRKILLQHDGQIHIYIVDPSSNDVEQELRSGLRSRVRAGTIHFTQIPIKSDIAFQVLVEVLREINALGAETVSWVPSARHNIISQCPHSILTSDKDRFCLELILQAVKSSGFVHLESFSQVPRLKRHGNLQSASVIQHLLDEEVLINDTWLTDQGEREPTSPFVPNYGIGLNTTKLADWMTRKFNMSGNVISYRLESGQVTEYSTDIGPYIKEQLVSIERAPDIEISSNNSMEADWNLGPHCKVISSTRELFNQTQQALTSIERDGGTIRGIWSTGEWLFQKDGWANQSGESLLNKPGVHLQVVITDRGGVHMRKTRQREQVMQKLEKASNVEIRYLNWWELNRILTIFEPESSGAGAIYFRRRLNQPIVQPYWVPVNSTSGNDNHTQRYVKGLWDWYWDKAKPTPTAISGPVDG